MSTLTSTQWAVIAAIAAMYVVTCVRVAMWARAGGRNPILWFFLTFFLTAIPAMLISLFDQRRAMQGGSEADGASADSRRTARPRRCRHCRRLVFPDQAGPNDVCPHCGLPPDQATHA